MPANAGDTGLIPKSGRTPGEGNGNSLQYSCLGSPRRAPLRGLHFPDGSVVKNLPANVGNLSLIPGSGDSLEKEMATNASILAWDTPWKQKPRGLQSMGSQKSWTRFSTQHTPIDCLICKLILISPFQFTNQSVYTQL